jgi:acetoacetyl-CoA reductase
MNERRVAVVTGGTRGIGAAITTALANDGIHVATGYHNNHPAAEAIRDKLAAEGHSVSIHQGSVGDPGDCLRVVGEILETFGRVDYLINNAGVTQDKTVRKMTVEDWHAVLRVNLSGAFYMTKAVLEHMIDEVGNIGQANYAASKAGLFGFTKSLALETARKGITVNCVTPGFVDTEMVTAIPEAAMQTVLARIPIGRLGRANEIARAVRFLLDDQAGYITGSILAVNGGLDM